LKQLTLTGGDKKIEAREKMRRAMPLFGACFFTVGIAFVVAWLRSVGSVAAPPTF